MPIQTSAAQPLPVASAPQQPVPPSAPLENTSRSMTAPLAPGYNAITVQLQPGEKKEWFADAGFWGAIIPALALLVTIWNTNKQLKSSREMAERQMQNTRDQARLDRTMQSRKATFEMFIDDFKNVSEMIGGLPSKRIDTDGPEIKVLNSMNATVNKIWLWAEVETVRLIRDIQADINEYFMRGLMECRPIWELQKRAQQVQSEIERLKSDRDKFLDAIRTFQHALGWADDPSESSKIEEKKLHSNFANAQAGVSVAYRDLHEIEAEVSTLRQTYLHFINGQQPPLMVKMTKIMTAVRHELHSEGDTSILDAQTEEMKRRVSEAIQEVDDRLNGSAPPHS